MVIPGIAARQDWSAFDVAVEGARPALMIEITSPETRVNDLKRKVAHYARAGVAQYVIVDRIERGGARRVRLLDYRWKVRRTGCRRRMPTGECTWRLPTYGWAYGATTWCAMTRRGGRSGTM
jgi:Protein of unknown function (DUF820).